MIVGSARDQAPRRRTQWERPQGFGQRYQDASGTTHCTVDPATVPKLMDVITPPGVDQSDEVDYTIHTPVVLSGVAIP